MNHVAILQEFMKMHYSDERLAMLLAHAESGRLSFCSCCCFIGVVTADHPLRTYYSIDDYFPSSERERMDYDDTHYKAARLLPLAVAAEFAFMRLGMGDEDDEDKYNTDANRRAALIPLIREEMQRRERLRMEAENKDVSFCSTAAKLVLLAQVRSLPQRGSR